MAQSVHSESRLAEVAEKYLLKGSTVYLEGQLETRKWTDKNGAERYSTEVVLRPYRGEMQLLGRGRESDSRSGDGRPSGDSRPSGGGPNAYTDKRSGRQPARHPKTGTNLRSVSGRSAVLTSASCGAAVPPLPAVRLEPIRRKSNDDHSRKNQSRNSAAASGRKNHPGKG